MTNRNLDYICFYCSDSLNWEKLLYHLNILKEYQNLDYIFTTQIRLALLQSFS